MKQYTIGQAASLVNLSTKTIRFYEDSGVITPALRLENGYRMYPASTVEELKILKYARDMGLPLAEIKKLMRGCDRGDCHHSGNYVRESISNYLHILDEKIMQMTILRHKLSELSSHLVINEQSCATDGVYCCNILHQLLDYTKGKGVSKK